MGDFHGKVGTNGIDRYPDNCGKYGVGRMNEERERLQDLCGMNNFADVNSAYKQRKYRFGTWISPDGTAKIQIDYILVLIDQKGLIEKWRVLNSVDINSDHPLLMAKYTTFVPKVKRYKRNLKRFDVSKLQIGPIFNTLKIHLGGTFEPLINDISNQNVEDCYNKFMDVVN